MSILLEVDDLKISARKDDDSILPIVKGVSFKVARGEVVALIGESGSGKTTAAAKLAAGFATRKTRAIGADPRRILMITPDKRRTATTGFELRKPGTLQVSR